MRLYEIYRESETLELVGFVKANDLEEAKRKAKRNGYSGEYYRIEEAEDD